MNAARSGNKNLVRKLVQDHGVVLETTFFPDILFGTINNADMVRFLIEELQISSLDAINGTWCNLMESALLNRSSGTVKYLLEKRSAEEWASRSHGQLLHHSIFLWNSVEISRDMIPTVSPHCVQAALKKAQQYGNLEIAQTLVDDKNAKLS